MVISHQNKYVYIQVPHSASTAIAAELCARYGGESILSQHATYYDFLRHSSPHERTYRVIASLRHPGDVVLTQFIKIKTDHKQRYSKPSAWQLQNRVSRKELLRYADIQRRRFSFAEYFLFYHRGFYNDFAATLPPRLFRLIRYDRLQDDFRDTLLDLGMQPIRPLPLVNKTEGKLRDWSAAYAPSIVPAAQRHFGPYLEMWDFSFPADWPDYRVPAVDRLRFRLDQQIRRLYHTARAHPLWPGRRLLKPRVPLDK